jgi:acyl dehydratase
MTETVAAPKVWRGRLFEDFDVGDRFRSRLGRTVTETDNVWFTTITQNTNQLHFNAPYSERTRFGRPLVNSCFTLSLVVGLSVADTSENAAANLSWTDIKLPSPVFVGDTLWAESEVTDVRASESRPSVGIVGVRTRGVNQRGQTVIEFRRSFMVYRRGAAEASDMFPEPQSDWTV